MIIHNRYNILVTPADLVREALISRLILCEMCRKTETHLDRAELASWLQPQHPQRLRNHHLLLAVVRRGHALEELQALNGCRPPSGFVGKHTADGLEENLRGSTEMERTRFLGVNNVAFVKEVVVPQLYKCTESDLPHIHCKRVNAPCCGRSCRKC